AFTDADCQFHLADLDPLLLLTERHDLAVGFRLKRQDRWQRRFFSWGYNQLARTLVGTQVRDCDCALKVFRREALANLMPETRGFFVNTEILARARQLGYRVAETGVRHRPRLHGSSKVSLWDIPRTLRALLPFWWSRVLFPAQEPAEPSPPRPRNDTRIPVFLQTLALVVVAALLFFSRLGCPLQEPEEPRYAEIPRQMLESGHFAVPVCYGMAYYDKPPLLYWLVMECYRLFGVHDWAARLVPCAAAFLTVLVTYFWGRRVLGQRAGLAGALILCLSARYVYLGRLLTMNSLLCLWVTAGLAGAHLAVRGPRLRWGWWLLSAASCALGVLTKGPVALLLVTVPVLALGFLDPRVVRPRLRGWSVYLGLATGLALPWYAAMAAADPEFLGYFFWRHNLLRYLAPFDHEKPFWFYVPELLAGMLPWSLLMVPLVRLLLKRDAPQAQQRPAALGYALLAAVWCLLFYSVAGSKRAGYILPAMPLLALALGCALDIVLGRVAARQTASALSASLLAYRANLLQIGLTVAFLVLAWRNGILKPVVAAALVGTALLTLAFLWRRARGVRPVASWTICGVTTFLILFAALHLALPGYARKFSMRGQVRPLAQRSAGAQVPVVCYPRHWDSVSFYLERDDVRIYTADRRPQLMADLRANTETLAFIKSDHSLTEFLRDLPGTLEFVPQGRQGQVTAGWVLPRWLASPNIFVER
ncbi:MAG: phospholipid carrier-dependent glycosyltransferase, partial [Planctomycetota bacterium]